MGFLDWTVGGTESDHNRKCRHVCHCFISGQTFFRILINYHPIRIQAMIYVQTLKDTNNVNPKRTIHSLYRLLQPGHVVRAVIALESLYSEKSNIAIVYKWIADFHIN